MAGLVPAIPLRWAMPCVPKRDCRYKPGNDEEDLSWCKRPAHLLGNRAAVDQLGERDVLERDAERLEHRDVRHVLAAACTAGHEIADLDHVAPRELSGTHEIA